MTVTKAIISTVLFFLFLSIIDSWILIDLIIDISVLTNVYYRLINGIIEVSIIVLFIYYLQGTAGIIPKNTAFKYYVLAIVIGGCYTFIQAPLNIAYNWALDTDFHSTYELNLPRLLTSKSIAIVLCGPIAEELFFKQHIQQGLHKK